MSSRKVVGEPFDGKSAHLGTDPKRKRRTREEGGSADVALGEGERKISDRF